MYTTSEEICADLRRGGDAAEAAARIETQLSRHYKKLRQEMQTGAAYSHAYDQRTCAWDALYDVSPSVKNYWDSVYPLIQTPKGRYSALLRFVNAREDDLGIPQRESVRLLRTLGWTPADVMAAYLVNRTDASRLVLSPDAVAEAVRDDMDTALRLLNREGPGLFPGGYDMYKHYEWIDFLYFFMEYGDRTYLTLPHRGKRLREYCAKVLERLERGPAAWEAAKPWANIPDFSIFEGAPLVQRHLMASAAGQRLRKGNENNGYYVLSFHLAEEDQGCGAALRFDAFNKSPDYRDEEGAARNVYFYRFRHFMPFDYVPESWRRLPGELPEDFVRKAHRAFSKLAGLETAD